MKAHSGRIVSLAFVVVAVVGCGGGSSGSGPTGPSIPEPEVQVPDLVRAFVEEAVSDLEVEAHAIWSRRNQFNFHGSALTLLGTNAVFDGTAFDPPRTTLEAAPTRCEDRFGHRLWQQLNRCISIGRDLTSYSPLLFIAERPRDEVDARHVLRYVSDDGVATIVYRENPVSRWDVVERPAMTASTSVARQVRIEVGDETFDLAHQGTIEIDEPGAGAVTFEILFPVQRLTIELQVDFVGGFDAVGTIRKGTVTLGRIGGQSRALTFDW